MSVPAAEPAKVQAPEADPVAIRACLTPEVAAVFDGEWEFVLEQAKASKEVDGIRNLLEKWRIWAYTELVEPGTYFGVLQKAAHLQAGGRPPEGSVTWQELRATLDAEHSRTDRAG
ncbi:MAG: DUF6247 family protein [Sporichthyaceae bacterium]